MHTIGTQQYDNLHITAEYGNNIQDKDIETLLQHVTRTGKVLDIGANLGTWSIIYSQLLPYSDIIMFEPIPEIAQHASDNLIKCGIAHTTEAVALSNFEGTGKFVTSGMHQTNKFASVGVDVVVKTLDSYEYTDVAFIKIDVEGHELEVLQGAVRTIAANKPLVLLEYHKEADADAIFKLIDETLQYDCVFFEGTFNPNQCNHILLKPRVNG